MYGLLPAALPIRILLVEDNADDVTVLCAIIEHTAPSHLQLTHVTRLDEVLQQLLEHQFDIILLDLSLPDSHGYATFEQVYAANSVLPIILLTADADEAVALRAMNAGAQDYLIKGKISSQLLLRAIRYAIEQKRTEAALSEAKRRHMALVEKSGSSNCQGTQALLHRKRELLTKNLVEQTAGLSVADSELIRAARLKDEFLATVSHELRTPLSVILTLAEAVGEHVYGELNERQQKALNRIRKSGRHLLALINDILDVSKIESGKVQLEIGPVSVQTLCEDCIQMVQEEAQAKGLMLSVTIDSDANILHADGRRLMQVLLNLLNNAIKFTPDSGSVKLLVESDPKHEQITFIVQDTGIGIEETDIPKLFEPFVQLDSRLARNYQGAGLGLTLVSRLVNLHGGTVSVESNPGVGSRFLVVLPWQKEMKPLEQEALTVNCNLS